MASAIQIETGDQSEAPESETDPKIEPLIADEPVGPSSALESSIQEVGSASEADQNNLVIPTSISSGMNYPQDALRDGAYEADTPGKINDVIRALRSQNWYTQNPSFRLIKEIREAQFEPGQWFVLGRNIYQAACGNAQKALEFLKNLDIELSRFPRATAIHLLNGMIFEVYFDRDGNFRSRPKAAHIEQIMREAANDLYEESRITLLAQLAPYKEWIPFKPGDKDPLPLDIKLVEAEIDKPEGSQKEATIQSVWFLNEEKLCNGTSEDLLENWVGPSEITAKQIKSLLSENYVIPEWAIQVQVDVPDCANSKLIIPELKVLKLDRPPYRFNNK